LKKNDLFVELEGLLIGSEPMRFGVADVAATNLKQPELARESERLLARLFNDASAEVRKEAATCFFDLSSEVLDQHKGLAQAFIASPAFTADHNRLIEALAELIAPLPDYTLAAIDRFMTIAGVEASSVAHAVALDARNISKLVFRLYDQTASDEVRKHCLDIIDRMEERRFYGVESELKALDA
jgi:hypothetical protein